MNARQVTTNVMFFWRQMLLYNLVLKGIRSWSKSGHGAVSRNGDI